jgi:hypothetical protein
MDHIQFQKLYPWLIPQVPLNVDLLDVIKGFLGYHLWDFDNYGLNEVPEYYNKTYNSWGEFIEMEPWKGNRTFAMPIWYWCWQTAEKYLEDITEEDLSPDDPDAKSDKITMVFMTDSTRTYYFIVYVKKEDEPEVREFIKSKLPEYCGKL